MLCAHSPSIFLDFNLPNAATWFYLSLIWRSASSSNSTVFSARANFDILSLIYWFPVSCSAGSNKSESEIRFFFGYLWLAAGSLGFSSAVCGFDHWSAAPHWTNSDLAGMAWMVVALLV